MVYGWNGLKMLTLCATAKSVARMTQPMTTPRIATAQSASNAINPTGSLADPR